MVWVSFFGTGTPGRLSQDFRPEVRSGLASVSALCRHGEMKWQETMSNPVQRKCPWHKDNLTHRPIWGNCRKEPKSVLGTPGRRFKSCCPDHVFEARASDTP